MAPQLTTTFGAFTVTRPTTSRVSVFRTGPLTPATRPSRTSTRSTRVSAWTMAPALRAMSTRLRSTLALPPEGQPKLHSPHPMHVGALRCRKSENSPSLRAPRTISLLFSPAIASSVFTIPRICSSSSKIGARCSGLNRSSPPRVGIHPRSTSSGVRKQIAEFTRLPPPTPRPAAIGIIPEPRATIMPSSCMW